MADTVRTAKLVVDNRVNRRRVQFALLFAVLLLVGNGQVPFEDMDEALQRQQFIENELMV